MMTQRSKIFEDTKQEVHTIIHRLGDRVPPQASLLAEEAIAKMKADNLLAKEALGFTPEMLEVIYRHGYHLFQSGKYQEALRVFHFLRQMDPLDPRYSFAIAACYHYSKEYLDAAANYIICSRFDPLNPMPVFHLYDCFLKANYLVSALRAIEEAILLLERDPHYANLKERAQLEMEYLKSLLKQD